MGRFDGLVCGGKESLGTGFKSKGDVEFIFVLGSGVEGGEACGAVESIVQADQIALAKVESICKVSRLRIY